MSSFTPVVTRSTSPTFPFFPFVPPLPPFGLFSSAIGQSLSLSFRASRSECDGDPRNLLFLQPRHHNYTPVKNAPGSLNLVGCPLGHEYNFDVSTRICPSGASSRCARSMGRGAGPSKLIPSLS